MTSVNAQHEALLDALLKDYTNPQDLLGEHGLLKQLTKRLVERVLEAELTAHLGYAPHVRHGTAEHNARNGKGHKTVQTDTGPLDLAVPRDRNGSFTPQLVPKRERRLEGFDAKVLSLYARGLSTREIQGHLAELYGTEVSPTLISTITDAVLEDVRTWQARPLASVYPILYFDALFVKSRQEGPVQTKAVYLALGVTMDGEKELLGLWLSESEGAKFWFSVFTELKNRGVQDCFIACVDGLQGLPEAIEAVFPKTQVQLCIVHKVRNSLKYVPWKERKYPAISPSWLADWDRLTVFFDYPPAIRRAVYTTNAIESLNYSLRKVLKGRSAFPNDESIMKVLYMGLQHVAKKWTQPIPEWKAALNQFVLLFGERVQV